MRSVIRLAVVVAALVAALPAAAVGPWLWTANGGAGIATADGSVHYVARVSASRTTVSAVRSSDGRRLRALTVPGRWGLQAVTVRGALTGLSGDGRLLVLAPPTRGEPASVSTFMLVGAPDLRSLGTISLRGDFSLDAVSPNGRTLYLIQHLTGVDSTRYQVRAYDLRTRTLVRRPVADKRQAGWIMHGFPMARASTPNGSRVYTLYRNDANYPFVHALDTVRRTAVCIGLPLSWTDPELLSDVTLSLRDGARTLVVDGSQLRAPIRIDTRTFRIR
jgi:hypothetical protein